jgi:hypothetical protein
MYFLIGGSPNPGWQWILGDRQWVAIYHCQGGTIGMAFGRFFMFDCHLFFDESREQTD